MYLNWWRTFPVVVGCSLFQVCLWFEDLTLCLHRLPSSCKVYKLSLYLSWVCTCWKDMWSTWLGWVNSCSFKLDCVYRFRANFEFGFSPWIAATSQDIFGRKDLCNCYIGRIKLRIARVFAWKHGNDQNAIRSRLWILL